jgi:hypothetical protein
VATRVHTRPNLLGVRASGESSDFVLVRMCACGGLA